MTGDIFRGDFDGVRHFEGDLGPTLTNLNPEKRKNTRNFKRNTSHTGIRVLEIPGALFFYKTRILCLNKPVFQINVRNDLELSLEVGSSGIDDFHPSDSYERSGQWH